MTFEEQRLEGNLNPLKTRIIAYVSNKNLSQKVGSLGWLPGTDDVIKKRKTYSNYDVTHKKQKSKTSQFFKAKI